MSSSKVWGGSRGLRGSRVSPFTTPQGLTRREIREPQAVAPPSRPPPLGELLVELKREDISQSSHDPHIRDCIYVASYSWLDEQTPTVLIPGRPPNWAPPVVNRRLDPDRGNFFRDPNAARYPAYPMEPAVQAVLKQHPHFPTGEIDIVTCASVLGNLIQFVHGVGKEFRIILEKVGNTVFLVRRENFPLELIPDVRGFGHTFPNEYTSWEKDVKRSQSHQRIVRYGFGGLQLLVRFEADGYFREKDTNSDPPLEGGSLVDEFGGVSFGHAIATGSGSLQIQEAGRPISQEAIFDIKTRSSFDFKTRQIKKEIDLKDILPKLWTSQIPTLIVGFHDRGLFEDIRVQNMRDEVKKWEAENADPLRQLTSLLHELIGFSRTSRTKLEICRFGSGSLEIRRLMDDKVDALPVDMKARWSEEAEAGERASSQGHSHSKFNKLHDKDLFSSTDLGIHDQKKDSDDESVTDYTACSEICGYCGHCSY